MPTTYTPPQVTIQAQGAQSLVSGGSRRPAILLLGTAPQGPDVPMVIDPVSAPTLFGDPANTASLGFSLPLMMQLIRSQSPPTGNAMPMQFIVCRAGVQRASATLSHGTNTNQVWTIAFSGTITAGAPFTLSFGTGTSAPISYSTTAATTVTNIQTALNGLSTVGVGNATVASTDATHFTITASGTLANQLLPNFSADGSTLTGTSPGIGVSILTPGSSTTDSFTVSPIGAYAGKAGDNIYVEVKLLAAAVTEINIWDSGGTPPQGGNTPGSTWLKLQTFTEASGLYDLTSVQSIANTINGTNPSASPSSIITAQTASGLPLPAAGLYQCSGGGDGRGTPVTDPSISTLLANSLRYQVDYIVAAWDANQLESVVMSHINDAMAQNQFRKAVLGPQQGTTYARLTAQPDGTDASTWYNNFLSSRVVLVGHDSVILPNPITGTAGIYDGFYLAAGVCGLKVASPVWETCTGWSVSGVVGIPLPPDLNISSPLTTQQKDALGAAGFLVLEPQSGPYVIRDSLTSTRFIVNNQINPFSQWNVQTIDDDVSLALLSAVLPFKGQAMPDLETANTQLQSACVGALAALGQAINGIKSVSVKTDPSTLVPTVDVVYITRFPFRTIAIRTSYTFL